MVKRGITQLAYIETDNMLADIFTKPLPRDTFEKHRASLVGGFSLRVVYSIYTEHHARPLQHMQIYSIYSYFYSIYSYFERIRNIYR